MSTRPQVRSEDLLSSGSTLLNLSCSGKVNGAFPKGTYTHFVGDSQSGKTLFCHNTLAEAAKNPAFANHRLVYDFPERRNFWDLETLWGSDLARRIEPPSGTREAPAYSRTIQDMYRHIYNSFTWGSDGRVDVEKSRPFVWIEDSMASLDEDSRWDKFETNLELAAEGKDQKGSYGMGKQKVNSDNILWVVNAIADTGSILVIINQTRDRVPKNQWDMGPKQTVAGGHSLKFYATYEIWSSVAGTIYKTVNGTKRAIGTDCELRIKKNSVTGRDRTVSIPVYSSYGIDDIGSCINFLVEEKHWVRDKGGIVKAPEFGHEGGLEKLVSLIEEQELEEELQRLVGQVWNEVESKLTLHRKPRYT